MVLIVLFSMEAIAGRSDKAGTAGASELLIPVGARSIALGGAVLSTVSGSEAIYWNPAGLADATSAAGITASHMSYLADVGVEYLSADIQLSNVGQIGASLKSLSVGTISVTTEDEPDGTGETITPTFLTASIAFGRRLSDQISLGLSATVVYERMGSVSATGIAFSGGVQYSRLGGIEGLSVGVAVKNIGPAMQFDGTGLLRSADVTDATRSSSSVKLVAAAADLPSTIEVGVGYTTVVATHGVVSLTTGFQNNNYSEDEYRFGTEYVYDREFAIRCGYELSASVGDDGNLFGPTFGVGFSTKLTGVGLRVDYAYRSVKYFSGNHVFSVSVEF